MDILREGEMKKGMILLYNKLIKHEYDAIGMGMGI
jgi:hypothetical protein